MSSVNAFLPPTVGGSLSTESSRCQQISEALSLERSELSEAESEQLRLLVMEYADQFALNPFELGQTSPTCSPGEGHRYGAADARPRSDSALSKPLVQSGRPCLEKGREPEILH